MPSLICLETLMYSCVSPGKAPANSAKYLLVSLVSASAAAKSFTNGLSIRFEMENRPPAALTSDISSAILSANPLRMKPNGAFRMFQPMSNPLRIAPVSIFPRPTPATPPATPAAIPPPPPPPGLAPWALPIGTAFGGLTLLSFSAVE